MLPINLSTPLELLSDLIKSGEIDQARKLEAAFRKTNPTHKFPSINTEIELGKFLTVDPAMILMKDRVRVLALEQHPVLIQGETGTGKEIIAKSLHGPRVGKFVALNCTSLPDYLLESELFGHKRGAFTGAVDDKIGLLQHAWGGTIFFDEIGDMPLVLQTKLLRALQEMRIRRVGDTEDLEINCRILSATHRNLKQMIEHGKFREDLYYRIGTFCLKTLPLRERVADDMGLILSKHIKSDKMEEFFKQLKEKVSAIELSGNVRELLFYIHRFNVFGKIED